MNLTESELRELVVEKLDPEELLEILDLGIEELAEAFSHRLLRHSRHIQNYLYPEDYLDE